MSGDKMSGETTHLAVASERRHSLGAYDGHAFIWPNGEPLRVIRPHSADDEELVVGVDPGNQALQMGKGKHQAAAGVGTPAASGVMLAGGC